MSAITTRYADAKTKLKRLIQQNMEQWVVIGQQLRIIKESGDWKQDCDSWADFCRKCCSFSKRFADQLIADTKAWIPLKEALAEVGTLFPHFTQLAAREIAQIEDQSERMEIAHEVIHETNGRPTRSAIKKKIEKRAKARVIATEPNLPMHTNPEPQRCPHCGQTMP